MFMGIVNSDEFRGDTRQTPHLLVNPKERILYQDENAQIQLWMPCYLYWFSPELI